jgi:signal-transduction protein with cAMP-binding, CBS, and nucleotidyltransferase domain
MVKKKVGSLLVVHNKKLIGIVTQKDILWSITKKPSQDLRKIKAIEIATKKVAVIKPSADLAQAFNKMREYGFRRLPVLSKGEVIGLLTLKDILKVEPAFYAQTGDLIDIKEEYQKRRRVSTYENHPLEGLCDECGSLAELIKIDDKVLCDDCREELY